MNWKDAVSDGAKWISGLELAQMEPDKRASWTLVASQFDRDSGWFIQKPSRWVPHQTNKDKLVKQIWRDGKYVDTPFYRFSHLPADRATIFSD